MFPSLFGLSEPAPERRLRVQSVATRRASLPCTIDVSRPRTRDNTTSTSLNAKPYSRTRWRQSDAGISKQTFTIEKPEVAENYYSCCASIDQHNRCRQDDLMLERKLRTQDWSFRVNTTVLGICIADALLLYLGEHGKKNHMLQRTFYKDLCVPPIENRYDSFQLRRRSSVEKTCKVFAERRSSGIGIHLTPTKKKRTNNGTITKFARQNTCRVCKKKKSTHSCSHCSEFGDDVWLCHTSAGRDCFMEHLAICHE